MPRPSNRVHRRLDPLIAEAERVLALRRDAVLPSDHALDVASRVTRASIDRAVEFYRSAVAGSGLEGLLDGPAREDEP